MQVWVFFPLTKDQEYKEDYETCPVCKKKFKWIVDDACYDCTYGNPLFWCYKHEHFSNKRIPCLDCFNEKKIENQKGSVLL